MTHSFHLEASDEYAEHVAFYKTLSKELGTRFHNAVKTTIKNICQSPLESVDNILNLIYPLVDKAIFIYKNYTENKIDEKSYLTSMCKLALAIREVYFKGTDIGLTPTECSDFSACFQNLIAAADNITLAFTDKSRTVDNMNYLSISAINDYLKEKDKLGYEREKLR